MDAANVSLMDVANVSLMDVTDVDLKDVTDVDLKDVPSCCGFVFAVFLKLFRWNHNTKLNGIKMSAKLMNWAIILEHQTTLSSGQSRQLHLAGEEDKETRNIKCHNRNIKMFQNKIKCFVALWLAFLAGLYTLIGLFNYYSSNEGVCILTTF